jgi:hypothetical protein
MRLCGRLVEVAGLTDGERRAMVELMERHYQGVDRAVFEADLAEKRWVIQVVDAATGELGGFSTQMVLEATVDGRPVKALFSGDTIVDRERWGERALVQAGGRLAMSLVERWGDAELYWFLISQGYKTYRFLPVFFQEFYPRYDAATPERLRRVIDALAGEKFPQEYDPAAGIVRASAKTYRLREGVADVTPERLRDPHVRFFVERNPGHALGDELCCIAPLSRENFTDTARRVLESSR